MKLGRFESNPIRHIVEEVGNRIAVVTRGWDMALYKAPEGTDSNGAGRVLSRSLRKGTITVRDFRSGKTIELLGLNVSDPSEKT